jgi:kumamolisin
LAQRYAFPTDADGSGQTVALIELGGGYQASDLATYFRNQGLRTPQVAAVSVDGAGNAPGSADDAEVALDIEVVGAVAQGAAIAVYFAPNTTRGFYDAIAAAMHDQEHKPSVVSISWGGPEETWTAQAMVAFDALFADAATLGITVFGAAGDSGASDGFYDGANHVDFPASSPHVVGCGGTTLTDSDETVWNELQSGHGATGGGVSRYFDLPDYQRNAHVPLNPVHNPGRGVPDVAGDADPLTGYVVRVDGQEMVIGGTSAVAPLWAGLIAIANQKIGHRVGALHDALYNHAASSGAFNDIVTGGIDGGLTARPGWDPCTGLGTPWGDKLVAALTARRPKFPPALSPSEG